MSEDLTGQKFGRLTVIKKALIKKGHHYILCLCDCGKEVNIQKQYLKDGHTKSCGCLNKELHTIHGFYKHPLYRVYYGMVQRCLNKKSLMYKYYGLRDITICSEWFNNPKIFIEWALNNGWNPGLQIDRINNNGNYEPSKCRFVNQKINNRNRSRILLNIENVRDIKRRILNGEKTTDIANIYKIDWRNISAIKSGKIWSDIKI